MPATVCVRERENDKVLVSLPFVIGRGGEGDDLDESFLKILFFFFY